MPIGQVFENAWDCETCGTKGISALKYKTCPNCGASAPGSDKEYIADLNHPLTDFSALEAARQEANWTCRFCHTRNPANRTECMQCGNARGETDTKVSTIDYGASAPIAPPVKPFVGQSKVKYKPNQLKRGIIGAIVVVLLAIIGLVAYTLLHKTTIQAQVTGFVWTRQINIDLYQTVQEISRSVPPGGRMISSHQVVDHYYKVYQTQHVDKTCYRNNGNGSSSSYDCGYDQQVLMGSTPVYAIEYTYKIDRWKPYRTVNASGIDRNPVWPQYTLVNNGAQILGGERVNSQNETYSVKFINNADNKQFILNTSLQEWSAYQMGGSYPLLLNFRGDVINDPLKPDNPLITATAIPPTITTDSADTVDTTSTPEQ